MSSTSNQQPQPQMLMEHAVIIEHFLAEISSTELTVYKGDFVHVLYHIEFRWAFVCRLSDQRTGYVPYLYLAFICPASNGQIPPNQQQLTNCGHSCSGSSARSSSDENLLTSSSPYNNQNHLLHYNNCYNYQFLRQKVSRSDPDGNSSNTNSNNTNNTYFNITESVNDKIVIQQTVPPSDSRVIKEPSSKSIPPSIYEPYKTIVHEKDDCLEKLTLV